VMDRRATDALWGVGLKRSRQLADLGILTVVALAEADEDALARAFGPNVGRWLKRLATGEDDSPVVAEPHRARSRGRETTFQQDLADPVAVRQEVRRLAREVVDDVRNEGRPAVRVIVKVRFAPFTTHTHGVPLEAPTADAREIEEAALRALERFRLDRPVRLLGVRAEITSPG
jgi:nucleotidyltransferase/DNA polymerase involved in DNA repair